MPSEAPAMRGVGNGSGQLSHTQSVKKFSKKNFMGFEMEIGIVALWRRLSMIYLKQSPSE